MNNAYKVLLTLVLIGLFAVEYAQYRTMQVVATYLVTVREGQMTTSWRWMNPNTNQLEVKTVTTAYEPPETVASWRQRHFDAVTAAQVDFPPYTGN